MRQRKNTLYMPEADWLMLDEAAEVSGEKQSEIMRRAIRQEVRRLLAEKYTAVRRPVPTRQHYEKLAKSRKSSASETAD
jgi:hypothetical protein